MLVVRRRREIGVEVERDVVEIVVRGLIRAAGTGK